MKYTERGLQITLEELRELLEKAERAVKYESMTGCLFIKGGEEPKITQYCAYAECNPIDYTYMAHFNSVNNK